MNHSNIQLHYLQMEILRKLSLSPKLKFNQLLIHGLEVFENKNLQFVYIKHNGERYTEEGDVIYNSAHGDLIKEALLNNKEITHHIPHW